MGWRWVFFAPVVLAALVLLGALALVPKEARTGRTGQRLDLTGGLLVTSGVILLVLGVERAAHAGASWTALTVGAGLALLALFAAVERRVADPLVRPGVLRSGPLLRANAGALLFSGGFFGFQFLMVLYLQELRGWSTVQTSLAMIVIGIDALLSPTLVPRLVARFGNGRLIFFGLLCAALAYGLFLPLGADWSYLVMLPGLILLGLAFALVYGPLTIVATEGVKEEDQGLAAWAAVHLVPVRGGPRAVRGDGGGLGVRGPAGRVPGGPAGPLRGGPGGRGGQCAGAARHPGRPDRGGGRKR